ncbi:MAG: YifB family Mg chelatase-like AAA ATPase [bacterium]
MTLAIVKSRALCGFEAPSVTVEVHAGGGLPGLTIVGLPEAEVREAKDRVRAALQTAGFEFPPRKLTINLAPADLPKESARLDLPRALGILAASGQLPVTALERFEFAGELSLSGEIRPVKGALALALGFARQRRADDTLILPEASASEAQLIADLPVYAAATLTEVVAALAGRQHWRKPSGSQAGVSPGSLPDLADVKGQPQARRALEIAAAGGHHLLMCGPPGTGKSMLAQRLPGLLPDLARTAAIESAAMLSLAGLFRAEQFGRPAFRAPHHSASLAALVGGGNPPQPGEASLAHQGVLFLDEFPEFDRRALESLREPIETGLISVARAGRRADYPARFQLVAAMNPCPCGYWGHPRLACRCNPQAIERYRQKISGPLADRLDIQMEVPALEEHALLGAPTGESSAQVAERVQAARLRALTRQQCVNALIAPGDLEAVVLAQPVALQRLKAIGSRLAWSARALHRCLRVARTIADLQASELITEIHVTEAAQYRRVLSPVIQPAPGINPPGLR